MCTTPPASDVVSNMLGLGRISRAVTPNKQDVYRIEFTGDCHRQLFMGRVLSVSKEPDPS